MLRVVITALALSGASLAHGDHGEHGQKPIVDENANWMTKHMAGKDQQLAVIFSTKAQAR